MFERINHVGIAVEDLDEALERYDRQFGVELLHRELLDGGALDAALLGAGEDRIELVASHDSDSPLGRFLSRRGPGLHHIAYEVADIEDAIDRLRARAVKLVDESPRPGIHGTRVAFLHPSSCFGVLTELVEPAA
ncbi:MAG: methylmalonyl-CoA epimerase [Solirubrobacteraceae bacterium]